MVIAPASATVGHAQVAKKKCKKSKKAAVAKKKKCKKKQGPAPITVPPTTSGPTGSTPPLDTDGDGVPDATDNCVATANSDQLDADSDGHGDVCDACPETANPGSAECPVTLSYMNVDSPLCVGSNPAGGSVVLTGPSLGDTVVALTSSDGLVATVPGSVTVLDGQTSGSFDITGVAPGSVDITATLGAVQDVESRTVEVCPP